MSYAEKLHEICNAFGDEMTMEEAVAYTQKLVEEAEASYEGHPRAEKRHCPKCGMLMRYNSLAYIEGWHFDSCF